MSVPGLPQGVLLANMIAGGLQTEFADTIPSDAAFIEAANRYRRQLETIAAVSDAEFDAILRRLQTQFTIMVNPGEFIVDTRKHAPWLHASKPDIEFFYWNRYRTYLKQELRWNPRMMSTLDAMSDELLDLLGDPRSTDPFRRRGLILGDVQSGKTAQYIALINKAVDAGYRMVFVLAGMQNNLREQTQRRLDLQFTGNDSAAFRFDGSLSKMSPIGVGRVQDRPDQRVAAFTTVAKDFVRSLPQSCSIDLRRYDGVILCVVKKQYSVLNNLYAWLQNSTDLHTGKIDLPLLLVDDESDNASINTNREGQDPTTINKCIRRLLNLFTRTSYVGITATPYANIFIDPDSADEMLGDDLFPKDFIYVMSPPANYVGASRLFGDSDNPTRVGIVPLSTSEMETYYPYKHKKTLEVAELPPSMEEAAAYFLLANVVRDLRGDTTAHRSMLVHVSRFTAVQTQTKDALVEWLTEVQNDVLNYGAVRSVRDQIKSIQALHHVWTQYDFDTLSGTTWDDVCDQQLYRSIAPVCVREVNHTSAAGLDYAANEKNGLRVIAVGGNSLSRGLTLEGLMVSYFYRRSMMYDTLMQMGRWFGYRDGYEDLTKLWMAQDAIDWYGRISEATEELKRNVISMRASGQTPQEFGLMVRKDPESLRVTALNKMRNAATMKRPISISGRLIETPRLRNNVSILNANEQAVRDFISGLADTGKLDTDQAPHYYWRGVPKDSVAALVSRFDSHPWHLSFQSGALAEYIDRNEELWDVVLMNAGEGDALPDGFVCGDAILTVDHTAKRKYLADTGMISISGTKVRVGSGGCTRIGLNREEIQRLTQAYRSKNPGKNLPDSVFLVPDRAPLLMIHTLHMEPMEPFCKDQCPKHVLALGLGFPASESGSATANYVVNLVELRNYMDCSDLDGDE